MEKKNNLQAILLTKLRKERQVVTVFITNGFQMRGRITAFDQHAVSTIVPDAPMDLPALDEVIS